MKLSEFTKKYGDVEINEKDLKDKLGIKNKVWHPGFREEYYFINDEGCVLKEEWTDNGRDILRYDIGNCFKTKQEAENYVEKLVITAKLKRFAEENNDKLNWNDDEEAKYCLAYEHDCEEISVVYDCSFQRDNIYFASYENAKSVIKIIGADRLKKYYFEVEDEETK